jgi:dihydroneopterin triphosphate diphosphatase
MQILLVPYRKDATGLSVLVLRRSDYDVWQFVSGGAETGESPEQAARREGFEEAGIPQAAAYLRLDAMAMVPACWFSAWPRWPDSVLVVPEHAFAVDVGAHEPVLSNEHVECRWVSFDGAIDLVRFDSNRVALWELHERLYPGMRRKRSAFEARHAGACACSPAKRRDR